MPARRLFVIPSASRAFRATLVGALSLAALAGCETTPTGRSELILVSSDQMSQLGDQAFAQVKKQTPVSHDAAINRFVGCVANAVTAVTQTDYQWQVTVFQSKEANAFALPGGKIGVYTGLLKYAKTQDELAAVIGHEVGHVLARHMDARVSREMAAGMIMQDLNGAIGGSGTSQQTLMEALGVGAQYGVLLPYSRADESEADLIGLNLMAQAGFDPEQSIQLWHNMQSAGSEPPAFLSDHPSSSTRIQDLQSHMPAALAAYHQAQAAGKNPKCGSAPPVKN